MTSPSFSTWDYDVVSNSIATVPPRSPSPPPVFSTARHHFDQAIQKAGEDRVRYSNQTWLEVVRSDLLWRDEQFAAAENQKYNRKTYRYLRPWSLEMRMQCAMISLELLEKYYALDRKIEDAIKETLHFEVNERPEWDRDQWVIVNTEMLLQAEMLRVRDKQDGNDFKVLTVVLDRLEEMFREDAQDEGKRRQEGILITDIPPTIRQNVSNHSQLEKRYIKLRDQETMEFPFRCERLKRRSESPLVGGQVEEDKRLRRSPGNPDLMQISREDFYARSNGSRNAEF